MKKVGIIGTRGFVPGCAFMATSPLLGRVGQNTGNLLFQYAVCQVVSEEYLVIGEDQDLGWDVREVQDKCRSVVVPSANFIRENFDCSQFVDFLEAVNLPLVFVGLGAQAENYDKKDFSFHSSVRRLMSLLRERCVVSGVRGEFSRSILARYGVENTLVTGCPSNFLNNDSRLCEFLREKWEREPHSLLVSGDEPWPRDMNKRDVERKLIRWASAGESLYVQQSVEPFVQFVRRRNPYQSDNVGTHTEESLKEALAPWMSGEEFRIFVGTRLRMYYSVDQWLEDAARYDLSVGLRLHGNMVAWQAGTPAIWVCHDARTMELAETMGLPHVRPQELLASDNASDLKKSLRYSFSEYEDRRAVLQSNLCSVFGAAEIKCVMTG